MELVIKKVENGYVVEIEDPDTSVFKTVVFTKQSQVIKFLKEKLNDKSGVV